MVGDFVKIDCAACHHVALLTPEARILRAPAASQLYELAGPRVYIYQELLRTIAARAGARPFLVPFPFSLWHVIGYVSEALPSPPITRNQVELMERDNIADPDAPGFEALQISPQAIENILPQMLQTLAAPPVA